MNNNFENLFIERNVSVKIDEDMNSIFKCWFGGNIKNQID